VSLTPVANLPPASVFTGGKWPPGGVEPGGY
jgi:hypothetical protein